MRALFQRSGHELLPTVLVLAAFLLVGCAREPSPASAPPEYSRAELEWADRAVDLCYRKPRCYFTRREFLEEIKRRGER